MRKKHILWMFILFTLFISSCTTEDYIGSFDEAIIESSDNPNKFRQITFTINIVNNSSEYVYATKLESVKLKVNGKDWGEFTSEDKDTSAYSKKITNNLYVSDTKITYLLIAPYYLKTDSLETAGEFVEYLNNRIILTPGEYVCEVSEITFRDINNQTKTIKPQAYKDFKVIENTTSSFIGEITIKLEN